MPAKMHTQKEVSRTEGLNYVAHAELLALGNFTDPRLRQGPQEEAVRLVRGN